MKWSWSTHVIADEVGLISFIKAMLPVLNKQNLVLLKGDLGAGKTTFIKHWTRLLNPQVEVQSPTFGLVNEYVGPNGELLIAHMDLYRLNSVQEFWAMGAGEYLDAPVCVCIEWPEIMEDYLKQEPHCVLEIVNTDSPHVRSYHFYRYL